MCGDADSARIPQTHAPTDKVYTLAILLYMLAVRVAALFNKKAALLVRGHRDAWRILREAFPEDMPEAERPYWFHAASLGEFEQGRPLMERLRREKPDARILLTFFSPSGYEVRKNYEVADVVCYLPFDTPFAARRFRRIVRPRAVFLIKYEFWRNYIEVLSHHKIPVYSVSSIFRKGQIFFRPYAGGYARCLKRVTHFFVQNETSRELLASLGVTCVSVVGDTRFDRVLDIRAAARPLPLVEQFAKGQKVVVAGSSWAPDEDLLIAYFNAHPELRLVLAPHVVSEDHLSEIEQKLKRPALRYTRAADAQSVGDAECLIIDCYGLLSSIYRYATIAYVGGGFGVGIHNVPEAAVYGCPVLFGPNNKKFLEAQELKSCGGSFEIGGRESFVATMDLLLSNPEALKKAGDAAGSYISGHAGAADAIFAEIDFN